MDEKEKKTFPTWIIFVIIITIVIVIFVIAIIFGVRYMNKIPFEYQNVY